MKLLCCFQSFLSPFVFVFKTDINNIWHVVTQRRSKVILPPTPCQMQCGMQQPQYTAGLVINLLTSLAKPLLCGASHKPFYPLISVVVRENKKSETWEVVLFESSQQDVITYPSCVYCRPGWSREIWIQSIHILWVRFTMAEDKSQGDDRFKNWWP